MPEKKLLDLPNFLGEEFVVLDIESWTVGTKVDASQDELRYVGFIMFVNGQSHLRIYHYPTEIEQIQKVLSYFRVYVGHNIKKRRVILGKGENDVIEKGFDIPMLQRHDFDIPTREKILLDTQLICENRAKSMLLEDISFNKLGLRSLAERYKLPVQKGDIDYSILEAEVLTGKNYEDLCYYLEGDLVTTYYLLKYYHDKFIGFKEFTPDLDKYYWLLNRSGSLCYKIICPIMGLKELYARGDEDDDFDDIENRGGYVALPDHHFYEGSIYCIDFNSLYPHIMMQCNLFGPLKPHEAKLRPYWNGNGIIASIFQNEIDGVQGVYNAETLSKMSEFLGKVYDQRATTPKSDPLNFALKIVINTIYGILGSSKFISIYNPIAAADCTAVGRRLIKHSRTVLEMYGYSVIYSDTDSAYIIDPHKNEGRLTEVIKKIEEKHCLSFPFPRNTYKFSIDARISHIYFFKKDDNIYAKKHYVYYDIDKNKLEAKGIRIVRGDCSNIAKHVYEKYIKQSMIDKTFDFMTYDDLAGLIKRAAKENPELLQKRYRVKELYSYKSLGCLNAKISAMFGQGDHHLVANVASGVEGDTRYDTLDNLIEKFSDSWVDYIQYSMYVGDLRAFMIVEDRDRILKERKENIKRYKQQFLLSGVVKSKCGDNLSEDRIKVVLKELLTDTTNLELFTKDYNVKELSEYGEKSIGSISAQISKIYGAGTHKLIANKVFGVGKKKKYATIEEILTTKQDLYSIICIDVYVKQITKEK